jgi:hypothetical protein
MLRPSVDEILNRECHGLSSAQALVVVPEPDDSLRDRHDPPFRDWRPPHVAPGVTQEMFFSVEGLYMYIPMSNFLVLQQKFEVVPTHW